MLTDIVVADENEAPVLAKSANPLIDWKGFDAKGQSPITLGTLLCLLVKETYRDEIVDEFSLLAEASDDGPWVFQLPDRLVFALGQIQIEEVEPLALQWSRTDEMMDVDSNRVREVIENLRTLSVTSYPHQKNILMWICL